VAEPAIPSEISAWMNARHWGMHHVIWHLSRIWDLIGAQDQAWVQQNGGSRANRQEGEAGNGLDFLAMHRVMLRQLKQQFPANANLFAGWPQPPTDPDDVNDPMPNNNQPRPFNGNMSTAISRLQNNIAGFQSDDDLGLYIETRLRPVAGNPRNQSNDNTTGIHNYLHNRFSDATSQIDMGDPTVNIHNQRFWRLHGWIDNRWSAFRTAKNLAENEPAYQQALADAAHHMEEHQHMPHLHMMAVTHEATDEWLKALDVPKVGRHFFRFVTQLNN